MERVEVEVGRDLRGDEEEERFRLGVDERDEDAIEGAIEDVVVDEGA